MRTLPALDSSMAHIEVGTGEATAVFLHGNPTSSHLWQRVLPHLAGQARCLAVTPSLRIAAVNEAARGPGSLVLGILGCPVLQGRSVSVPPVDVDGRPDSSFLPHSGGRQYLPTIRRGARAHPRPTVRDR